MGAIILWSTFAWLTTVLIHVPPFLLMGSALTLGSLCGLPQIKAWKVSWTNLAIGIYGLFGYHLLLLIAFRNAPAIETNLINYLWPILMVVLSPIFLREVRLRVHHVFATILGFLGALLILTDGTLSISFKYGRGYGLAAIAAFIWASYSLLSKSAASIPTSAVGGFCLSSGTIALACHFCLEPRYLFTFADLIPLLAIGLGPMGVAFFLWDKALKSGDPRIIGSLSYVTPMLSTLLLIAFGNAHFTHSTPLAMLLIISGAIVGTLKLR